VGNTPQTAKMGTLKTVHNVDMNRGMKSKLVTGSQERSLLSNNI